MYSPSNKEYFDFPSYKVMLKRGIRNVVTNQSTECGLVTAYECLRNLLFSETEHDCPSLRAI